MITKDASIGERTVSHFMYGLITVLALSSLILASPLHARIQLDIVAKFRNVGIELDIVTLVDWEVEKQQKVKWRYSPLRRHLAALFPSGERTGCC